MRILQEYQYLLKQRENTLNKRQCTYYNTMLNSDRMTLCIPTGAGKGYLMITHLMNRIINTKEDLFLTLSHRLTLNTQHLNDIVESLEPLIGLVGFIFVGSSRYINIYEKLNNVDNINLNQEELDKKIKFNTFCLKNKINVQDLFTNTLNSDELSNSIDKHRLAGRKIVIISTYHSANILSTFEIPIDVTYCDEAHTLATDYFDEDISFFNSYSKLKCKKSIFLTATPKDCDDVTLSEQSALMNNTAIYGERIGMSYKEAIEDGYVVQPVIHTATPREGLVDKLINLKSVSRFVMDSFQEHCNWVKNVSSDPELINGKLLIKCESVKMMWKLASDLIENYPHVTVCCGASDTQYDQNNIPIGLCHRINDEFISKREDYLERLLGLSSDEMAIVLHFDTLSEGINIPFFTGIMFLTDILPNKPKLLQNIGRPARLHPLDRERLNKKTISVYEYNTWVKPHCAVIIPYWSGAGDKVKITIAETVISLREEYGFKTGTDHGLGNDIGKGCGEPITERLNIVKYYKEGKIDLTNHNIDQIIEDLYIEQKNTLESEKLNKMTPHEWVLHNFS